MTKLSDMPLHNQALRLVIVGVLASFCMGQSCDDGFEQNSFPNNDSCVVDADCADGELCLRGSCALACVRDDDCSGGVCRTELRNEQDDVVDVCVDAEPSNNVAMECRFDSDCVAAFEDDTAKCGVDGVCFVPAFQYALLIVDQTEVNLVDIPEDGGLGADIAAVYLADPETGTPTAWGEAIDIVPANDVAIRNAPDGESRTLGEARQCVSAPFELAATPLGGDGGLMLVRFLEVDGGGVVDTAPESWNVVVVEWGENCPGGELGEQDLYEVRGCSAPTTDPISIADDCELVFGSGSGRLEFGGL